MMPTKKQLFAALSASLLMLSSASPALANLPAHLAPYGQDTAALVVVPLQPGKWKQGIQQLHQSQLLDARQTEAWLAELKALGIDWFWDGLMNLGSHLSLSASPTGKPVFVLDLRSGQKFEQVLQRVLTQLDSEANSPGWQKQSFAGYSIYSTQLSLFQALGEPETPLHLLIAGNQVLGSLGSVEPLKNMLYLREVLSAKNPSKLANQKDFQAVQAALGPSEIWAYVNTSASLGLFKDLLDLEELNTLTQELWLTDLLNYYQHLGFGASLNDQDLQLKSYVHHKTQALSPFQQKLLQSHLPGQVPSLKPLLQKLPAQPLLLTASEHLTVDLKHPWPTEAPLTGLEAFELLENADIGAQTTQALKAMTGLDLDTELMPYLDGRTAWSVSVPASGWQDGPEVLAVFGLKPGQAEAFETLAAKKLGYSLSGLLGDFDTIEAQVLTSSVKANMHTLQTIVETYGVDAGGVYPAQLETLLQAAQAETPYSAYWRDFANPVTQEKGLGKSLLPYAEFKADSSQVGMVYYEVRQPISGTTPPSGTAYVIYGYGLDGKLYALPSKDIKLENLEPDSSLPVVVQDLPQAEAEVKAEQPKPSPQLLETHNNTKIYSLPISGMDLLLEQDEPPEWLQPVFARQGDLFFLAQSPRVLKQALDRQNSQQPLLTKWQAQTGSQQAGTTFLVDLAGLEQSLQQLESEDRELQEIADMLKPLKSFYTALQQSPQGQHGQGVLRLDLQALGLSSVPVTSSAEAQQRAKLSSVKANMHTLQTVVETYAVDYGGIYAPDLQSLQAAAQNPSEYGSYWKDFYNPYTNKTGLGQSFLHYRDYVPGPEMAGLVLYEVLGEEPYITYSIYGTDQDGQLIQKDETPFILSNY